MPSRVIYVVDDNAEMRRSMHLMLSGAGYTVETFASGARFLECAARLPCGIVLLDLRMPDADGLEVLTTLAARHPQFPCLIFSGHGEIELAVKAIKSGARDFIEKPLREEVLIQILEREFDTMDANWALKSVRDSATKLVARLTERERQVFQGMARGLSNKLIAHHLGISTRTVEMHRAKMMNRLECESVAEVVGIALHSGEDITPWHHSAEKTNR